MQQRNVGKSGLRVSEIGLGCNNLGHVLDEKSSTAIVHKALDLGVTLFDTAPVYGAEWGASEKVLGSALGSRRKDSVIVTKFGMQPTYTTNTSRSSMLNEVEASLQRLDTDYIDLLMLHWPDWSTPVEETLRTLDDLIRDGKVRYIGCCNLPAWRVVEAQWLSKSHALHQYIVTQDEYSLANRKLEHDLMPALEEYQLSLMPYSPLANGLLTGKFSKGAEVPADSRLGRNQWNTGDRFLTEEKLALADQLQQFAADRGHSLLELSVSWLLSKPMVCSVIAGATKLEQVESNAAAGSWQLSPEELSEIDAICGKF